ncbi:DUF1648 domain-containing protein [Erythrobacter insulae]|uniref:DUF1648 domain-containing protein n=1 Tax=Erythrobacter insulae TaxID=2584124 RepID=A0A547PDF7_9SPHN|nr:SdpI family protein [Erythrobacter insulae]TRD12167.1 DUF1648 domain-containing protein [Erythrobacter insulae]
MRSRTLLIVSAVIAAAMVVFAFLAEARLPAGAELPVHWDATGTPDNFAPALQALLLPPIVVAAIAILFSIIPALEPLQEKLDGSAPLLRAVWIAMLFLMIVVQATIGLPAFGLGLPVDAVVMGVGVLLVVIGNFLPKSRPGFFVGIRTPWAITDTDNWIATHRLGGKLMMLAGACVILSAVLPLGPELSAIVVIGSVLCAALIPTIYSWWLWQSGGGAKTGDQE